MPVSKTFSRSQKNDANGQQAQSHVITRQFRNRVICNSNYDSESTNWKSDYYKFKGLSYAQVAKKTPLKNICIDDTPTHGSTSNWAPCRLQRPMVAKVRNQKTVKNLVFHKPKYNSASLKVGVKK